MLSAAHFTHKGACAVHTTTKTLIQYPISQHAAENKSSLVDHGANGGIAGDDDYIIDKTCKTVKIQGIDNHRINAIPIVTAGGVINTQKEPVIAIMHQYAYTGKGKSIHSCATLKCTSKPYMTCQ